MQVSVATLFIAIKHSCKMSKQPNTATDDSILISTTNPAITENTEWTIIKALAPVIDIKVGVSP